MYSYCSLFILLFSNAYAFNISNRSIFIKKSIISASTAIATSNFIINKPSYANDIYDFDNKSQSSFLVERNNCNVYFYGDVSLQSCILLRKAIEDASYNSKLIHTLYNIDKPPPIKLYITTFGGSLQPTFGIVDYIKSLDTEIHSIVDSYVASAGTLISIVCDKRYIRKHSYMLLHQLSGGVNGQLNKIEEDVENMNSFTNTLKEIYVENSLIKNNEIDDILKHDIWWNSQKCLQYGIIDYII